MLIFREMARLIGRIRRTACVAFVLIAFLLFVEYYSFRADKPEGRKSENVKLTPHIARDSSYSRQMKSRHHMTTAC